MKKAITIIIAVLLLVSCKTSEPAVQVEPIDIAPSMEILFDARPDNSKLNIITDIKTIEDIVHNSAEYVKAWEEWETYAYTLEDFIEEVNGLLNT